MELWLSWYETQFQEVLKTHFTADGEDFYECWEPETVVTSPYGYKRTNNFSSLTEAERWCEENSTDCSHYSAFIPLSYEEQEFYLRKFPVAEKWYYD